MTALIISLIIAATLSVGGGIGWSHLSREHDEAKNIPITAIDFSKLNDGTYIGEYEGGMYKWRATKVNVRIDSGTVKNIKLIGSSDPGAKNTDQWLLFDRVIKAQSLQVDAVSGATLTSKAYLKAVENALVKAEKK
jgi:uncharacterized protein with FMN-binding domain